MAGNVILFVEDNPDDVDLTLRAFRKSNLRNEIVVARDGVEALDYVFGAGAHRGRNMSDIPHLILLDLKLPRLNGMEVLKRLRADPRTRCIPIVILTSSREEKDLEEAYREGANSYIRKPVDFTNFLEAVRQVGLYWLVLNEPPPAAKGEDP